MDRRRVSPTVGTTNGYCGAMIGKDNTCLDDERDIRRWREGVCSPISSSSNYYQLSHHLPTTSIHNVSPEQPRLRFAHGKRVFDSSKGAKAW